MLNNLNVMDLDTLQNNFNIEHDEVTYHPVTQCPMCHSGVVPHVLGAVTVRPHVEKNFMFGNTALRVMKYLLPTIFGGQMMMFFTMRNPFLHYANL